MSERRKRLITLLTLVFWAVIISYAWAQTLIRAKLAVVFVGGIFSIYLADQIDTALDNGEKLDLAILTLSALITLVTTVYVFLEFNTLYSVRVGFALGYEYVLAALFICVVIYLAYREFGLTFFAVMAGGLLYGVYGWLIPGVFGHAGLTPRRIALLLVLDIDGFFGFITQIVAAWLALFLLLAGLLQVYGAFDLMIRASVKVSEYIESGVAQSAVVSSMIIGSINGSTAANTAMTGSFTIPLMKKHGMRSKTAGAIESVASTAGQVLPPVMGAAAFIMASLLNILYLDVAIAGLIPAIILVLSIGLGVHYLALGEPDSQTADLEPDFEERSRAYLVFESIRFGLPLLVLIYFLGVARFTVMTSALYTVCAMILTGTLIPLARTIHADADSPSLQEKGTELFWQTVDGFREGALSLAPIAIILVAINGVVTLLLTTGVPSKLSLALLEISGGVELIAVFMAMLICLVLGLGMPTAAAYLIVALLIAPTLIGQFGVPELAAHFFVFYCAILAAITPPVATSVAVATGIADSDFWATSKQAIKLAIPLFMLPFVFILHPEIISENPSLQTIYTGVLTLVGSLGVIHGLNHKTPPTQIEKTYRLVFRGLYVALGTTTMMHANHVIQTATGILVLAVIVRHSSNINATGWVSATVFRRT